MYVFIASLLLFMSCALKGWYGSLLDLHGFRQTQTAITVSALVKGGNWLRYETPVLGPPWSVPFEFPLYQWIVAFFTKTGIFEMDQAGRFVSLAFFLLALFAIFRALGNLSFGNTERYIILSLICISPQYLFWSRAFMIESTALALSACFFWLVASFYAGNSAQPRKIPLFIGVAILGSLAGAVKVTTFFAFWVGSLMYLGVALRNHFKESSQNEAPFLKESVLFALCALAVPAVSIFAWTSYADFIKELNPIGIKLTSKALSHWNFGSLTQKTSLATWNLFCTRTLM